MLYETKNKAKKNYHVLAQKHSSTDNPLIDFVEKVINVLNIPIDLLAFFPMPLFRS